MALTKMHWLFGRSQNSRQATECSYTKQYSNQSGPVARLPLQTQNS
jgi:hypothetical protein